MKFIFTFLCLIFWFLQANAVTCNSNFASFVALGNYCSSQPAESCETTGRTGPKVVSASEPSPPDQKVYSLNCVVTYCADGFVFPIQSATEYVPKECGGDTEFATNGTKMENNKPKCGSIINAQRRVLGERIPLPRSSFDLYYSSDRVPGHLASYIFGANLSGSYPFTQAASLVVTVSNEIGNVVYTQTYSPVTANQMSTYQWNGLDSSGNETWGPLNYTYKYVVNFVGGSKLPIETPTAVGSVKIKKLGLGGWSPSIWHFYSHATGELYRGDGSIAYLKSEPIPGGFRVPEEDGSLVYDFNSLGQITHIRTSIKGTAIYSFIYSSGRLSQIIEPNSIVTDFNYNISGLLQSVSNSFGQTFSVALDANGFLQTINFPGSTQYQMTYSSGGLLLSFQKPNGAASSFTYATDGRLMKDEHSGGFYANIAEDPPDGTKRTFTYTTRMGRKTSYWGDGRRATRITTHPSGRQDILSFGNNFKSESAQGLTIDESRDPDTRLKGSSTWLTSISELASYGRTTSQSNSYSLSNASDPFSLNTMTVSRVNGTISNQMVYTGSTSQYVTTTAVGNNYKRKIDSLERPIEDQPGNLTKIEYSYTGNNLTQIKRGTRQTNFSFDPVTSMLASFTDSLSRTTSYSYDSLDRVQSVTLPDARVINYVYDSVGRLTSITPPGRPNHSFTFNSSELISSYNPPPLVGLPLTSTSYSYNDDNQLTSITRPTGDAIALAYDPVSGLLASTSVGGETYTTSYDSNDQISYLQSANSRIYRTYVSPNRVGWEEFSTKTPSTQLWGRYSYSVNATYGDKNQETVAGGASGSSTVTYAYNKDRMVTGISNLKLTYSTPSALLTGTTLGSLTDSFGYNSFGEMISYSGKYSGSDIYKIDLIRDDLGRVIQKTEVIDGITKVFEYTFDSVGRLTQVKKNGVIDSTYSYDSNSNRNGGAISGATTAAVYDDQDRVTSYNLNNYTYTANGDLLTKTNTLTSQTTSFSYDARGALRSVTLPNTDVISYEIDGFNRRIGRKLNGVVTRRYIYSGQYQIIGEVSPTRTLVRRYIYGTKSNIPDFYIEAGVEYRIFSDQLGSLRMVVRKTDGAIIQKMEHDEYGRVIMDTNPGLTPFGFAGGLYDPSTGLVRFGSRDFDTETGRWTSKDSILFDGGDANLYGYVMQDPVNMVDPTGNCPPCFWGAVVGGTASGLTAYASNVRGVDLAVAIGIGAASGALSGFLQVPSIMGNILSGAAISSAANIATQLATGTSFQNLNTGSVVVSAIAGGVGAHVGSVLGNSAFYSASVLGRSLGSNLAKTRSMWASLLSGTAAGTAIEGAYGACP